MFKRLVFLFIFIAPLFCVANAAEEQYPFDNEEQRKTFIQLGKVLRCPKCQNQNIGDSNAMISHDMRRKVFQLLKQGKTDQQVIDYMKSRYGDFVYYQPPMNASTVMLWLLPVAFLVAAFVTLWFFFRKRQASGRADFDPLSDERLAQAQSLLDKGE